MILLICSTIIYERPSYTCVLSVLFTSWRFKQEVLSLIRLLSLSVYILNKTGTAVNKVKSLLKSWQAFAGFHAEATSSGHWGNVISPLIANIFMEEFEVKALQSFPNPPSLWLRFVDDTFVINKAEHSQDLLQHINSQDPHIQFTVEPTQQGSLPFLDTLVTV